MRSKMISHGVPKTLLGLAPPPAALRPDPVAFLRRNPEIRTDLAARLSVIVAGIVFLQWPLVLVGGLLLVGPLRRWRRLQRTVYFGSAVAAKVVSVEPALVAFLGDLSRHPDETSPVLVVTSANLATEGRSLDRGDRIAVVALAVGGTAETADRFDAHVVSAVIARPEAIDRTLADVPEWQWDDLDEALFASKNLAAPGVHTLSDL